MNSTLDRRIAKLEEAVSPAGRYLWMRVDFTAADFARLFEDEGAPLGDRAGLLVKYELDQAHVHRSDVVEFVFCVDHPDERAPRTQVVVVEKHFHEHIAHAPTRVYDYRDGQYKEAAYDRLTVAALHGGIVLE